MNTWWVDLTIATGTRPHPVETCLAMQDELTESTVGNSPNGDLSISMHRDAATLPEAIASLIEEAERVVTANGLGFDPIEVDACSADELERRLDEPNYPDLVSGPEAAAILGVNRQRVHQLAHEHSQFPEPLYKLGVGSLWTRRSIEAFNQRWERKPGRPKATAKKGTNGRRVQSLPVNGNRTATRIWTTQKSGRLPRIVPDTIAAKLAKKTTDPKRTPRESKPGAKKE